MLNLFIENYDVYTIVAFLRLIFIIQKDYLNSPVAFLYIILDIFSIVNSTFSLPLIKASSRFTVLGKIPNLLITLLPKGTVVSTVYTFSPVASTNV